MWRIIMLLCIVTIGIATVDKVRYDGYKLIRIVPKTNTDLRLLQNFNKDTSKYSFWQAPSILNREVTVMVPPYNLEVFYKIINDFNMTFDPNLEVTIDDIQKLIDDTIPRNNSQGFDFKHYHTLEEIYDNLEELAKKYPNKVQVIVGGRTYEGREIKGVKIIAADERKRGIFIEGGMHAREWISPATVMYILHQLLTSEDSDVRDVADNNNWFIFPVFNPDGYVYSHVTDRLWSKTRKPSSDICIGSDPNKNWDFCWNTTGTSNNPCDNDYPGSEPFSEIEMKSMLEYMKSNIRNFKTYISFHSFSQQVLFPSSADLPDLYDDMHAFGTIAMQDIEKRYHTKYVRESISEYHRLSGSSVDYVFHVLRKSQVYFYKLRDKGKYGFLLPPELIIPTGEETLDSITSLLGYMI